MSDDEAERKNAAVVRRLLLNEELIKEAAGLTDCKTSEMIQTLLSDAAYNVQQVIDRSRDGTFRLEEFTSAQVAYARILPN